MSASHDGNPRVIASPSRVPHSTRRSRNWLWAGCALVIAGVAVRLFFRDIPNFSPVAAIALYAGFALGRARRAIWIPLAVMAASDWVIGGYDWKLMVVVYGMLALPVIAGGILASRRRRWGWQVTLAGGVLATVAGSLAFFFVTNTAVWAFSSWYARDLSGLVSCLSAGLPFFRYTLSGDLAFATVLFASHFAALALAGHLARSSESIACAPDRATTL